MSVTAALLDEIASLRERLVLLETRAKAMETSEQDSNPVAPPRPLTPQPSLSDVAIPMACTRVVMHQIVMPSEVDVLGICIGGQVLSWIDVCAGMSAKTLARSPCVTACVDSVHFLRPCCLGTVVIVAAMVNRTFSSSMEVGVRVEAEDMRTGVRSHCCSANLVFVALPALHQGEGPAGRTPLPRVKPSSKEHENFYNEAEQRRMRRLQRKQELALDPDMAAVSQAACRLRPITHRDGCPTLPRSIEVTAPASEASPSVSHVRRLVTPDLTAAYMTQSIMPQHANTLHITFGGQVMAWMEQCAYISASRMRGPHILTASLDSVSFGRTTRVGDILYLTSQVTAIFGSSMEVMVSVHGEDPLVGELFHCADAYVTVVTVKPVDAGSGLLNRRPHPEAVLSELNVTPVQLPFELLPRTPAEILQHKGALKRREVRLQDRRALQATLPIRQSLDGRVSGGN